MEKLFREFGGKIEFIGINQDAGEEIEEYLKENNVTFSIAYDQGKKIASSFGARASTHILIGVNGTVRYVEPHPPKIGNLEELIR